MSEIALDTPENDDDGRYRYVISIIRAAMALPGAKVDRNSFLRDQLRPHCGDQQAEDATNSNPADAGLPRELMDKIADSVIKSHVVRAAAGSFVAGIPGGLTMALTIPADALQYVWHAIVLAQKLAYLYGWPDLMKKGEPDVETEHRILLLIGSMMGIGEANRVLDVIAKEFAREVGRRLPREALTKTFYYPIVKEICKWLGVRLTKKTFAEGVARIIPIVSGGIGAAVTAITLRPMARKLKDHLKELRYAKGHDQDSPESDNN